MNPKNQAPLHLRILNSVLMEAAKGQHLRTLITFPPRHGKSETTSRYFPAWYLGMVPDDRVMLVSYAAEFAAEWGRKSRDILAERGPDLFNVRVRADVAARDNWGLERKTPFGFTKTDGGMVTSGIGGPITGRGADLIIIDDPIKNAEEAFSPKIRERNWEWFNSTLMSRQEPGARVILIQTRWHEDDLAGRVLKESEANGEKWHQVNFPALADKPNDILGREIGEALWPERYSKEDLERIKIERGSYWFSALYQQQPTPEGTALFKRKNLRRFSLNGGTYLLHQPDGTNLLVPAQGGGTVFSTVDLATSLKQTADYTVISTWLETPRGEQLLLDVVKLRLEGPDHVPAMMEVWRRMRPAVFYVEQAGFQLSTVQAALRAGLPVRPMIPDTDKMARALAPAAKMEAGMMYFPVSAPWLNEVEQEIFTFPAAPHDDVVDTLSLAAIASLGVGYAGNLG